MEIIKSVRNSYMFEIIWITEYYRFLHIQEECRIKWQATNDKLRQLMKQQEKYALEKGELKKSLHQARQMYQIERQSRRSIERERDFFVSIFTNWIYSTTLTIQIGL